MEVNSIVAFISGRMMYVSVLILILVNIINGRTVDDRLLVETLPGNHPMAPYTHMALAKSGGAESNLITNNDKPDKDKSPEELAPGPEVDNYEDWYDYDYDYDIFNGPEEPITEDGDYPVEVVALEDGGEVVEVVLVGEEGVSEPDEGYLPAGTDEEEEIENEFEAVVVEDEIDDAEEDIDEVIINEVETEEKVVEEDKVDDVEVPAPEDTDLDGNDTEEATYDIIEELESKGAELDVIDKTPKHKEEIGGFDTSIFESEGDLVVIMKTMYETLNNRIIALESRLTQITASDCSDIQNLGFGNSGVYTIYTNRGSRPVDVFCDMNTEEGGWTIIQRRLPHSKEIDFDRGWYDYKVGFGDASKDYWLGLENMHLLTNARQYELRIEISDFEGGSAHAHYIKFYIEGESEGYRLHVGGYSGTTGDSLGNEGTPDNFTSDNMMFTTADNDQDTSHEINCAKYWKIGGWWYNRCSWANLNGPYKEPGDAGDGIGINWHMWRNKQYLRSSTMMIRPTRNS